MEEKYPDGGEIPAWRINTRMEEKYPDGGEIPAWRRNTRHGGEIYIGSEIHRGYEKLIQPSNSLAEIHRW